MCKYTSVYVDEVLLKGYRLEQEALFKILMFDYLIKFCEVGSGNNFLRLSFI